MSENTNTAVRAKRGKETYNLTVNEIAVDPTFNVREDFGDMDALVESIKQNGVRVPVRGYKKDGLYVLIDGHRRFKACTILSEQGTEVLIPLLAEDRGSSVEQRVVDMLICNEGKKLNPVEQSEAVARLLAYGYSEQEISAKTGFSGVYVSNLKYLHNSVPKKIKNLIAKNTISSTLAIEILRTTKDADKAIAIIEKAINNQSAETNSDDTDADAKAKKVTKKDINKATGKTNSFSALKKAVKKAEKQGLFIRNEKSDIYTFAMSLYNNELTVEQIIDEIYSQEDVSIFEEEPA
jgi:ParB/RepB/Spo0J family partition protein